MSLRARSWAAWSSAGLCGLVALSLIPLGGFVVAVPLVAFPLVGALVISRRGNPIG